MLFHGKYTGFQAKFYTDNLPQKKKDILDAITTTRAHNTRVQKIIFFLPTNPSGVSAGVDEGQKSQWMKEAELTAKKNNLEIEWFGTSRFQVVLACAGLQLIARHFFDPAPDLWDFISVLGSMTNARLSFIRSRPSASEPYLISAALECLCLHAPMNEAEILGRFVLTIKGSNMHFKV